MIPSGIFLGLRCVLELHDTEMIVKKARFNDHSEENDGRCCQVDTVDDRMREYFYEIPAVRLGRSFDVISGDGEHGTVVENSQNEDLEADGHWTHGDRQIFTGVTMKDGKSN